MNDTKRLKRWAMGTLIALLGSALLIAVGAYFYLHSESGRDHLARLISQKLSGASATVIIGRLAGDLPQQIDLQGVVVSDAHGEWLRLDFVRLEWRPLELIKGRLHVTRATLTDVRISRQPKGGDAAAPDLSEWLQLPFSVALDVITLDNLTVAEPILGQAVTLRVAGASTIAADGIVHTSFSIERSDGAPGKAALETSFDPIREHLEVDADIHAPAAGARASALNIPGIAVKLSGSGPLKDWSAEIEAHGGDVVKLTAEIQLQIAGDRYRLFSNGNADIAYLFDAPVKSLVENGVSFSLDASSSDLETFELAVARLASDAATLELNGAISTTDIELKAGLQFTGRGSAWLQTQVDPLSASDVVLSARVSGPLLQPLIDAELKAAAISVRDRVAGVVSGHDAMGRFAITFDRPLTQGGFPAAITGKGTIDGVTASHAALRALLAGPLNWTFETNLDGNIQTLDVTQARVSTESATVTASGRIGLTPRHETSQPQAPSTSLDIAATLPDLARFYTLIGPVQGGAARIHSKIETNDFSAGFAASLDATFDQLQLGAPVADSLVDPRLKVNAELSIDHQGALQVSRLTAESGAVKLNGELDLSPDFEAMRAVYRLELDQVAGLLPAGIQGSALIEGSASGRPSNPSLNGTAAFRDVFIDDFDAGSALVEFEAAEIASNPKGRVRATIEQSLVGQVKAEAKYDIENFESIGLSGIALQAMGTSAKGELRIPFSGAAVRGNLSGKVDGLGRWSGVAGRELSGNASFDLTLDAAEDVQTARSTVRVSGGAIQVSESRRISADDLQLTAQILDPFETPSGEFVVDVNNVKLGNARLDRLSLSVDAEDTDSAAFDLTFEGELPETLQLAASGALSRRAAGVEIILNSLNAELAGNPVQLDGMATLVLAPELASINDLTLAVAGGSVHANAHISPDAIDTDVELSKLPLSLLDLIYAEARLEGSLSGYVRLRGTGTAPSGELKLSLTDVQQKTPWGQKLPKLTGSIQGDWNDNRLALAGRVTGFTEAGLELDAALPLRFAADSLILQLPLTEPMSGQAVWRGPVEPLLRLLPVDEHNLSGFADINIEVGGTLGFPSVGGTLKLEQGVYENFATATLIKDISLMLEGDGSRVVAKGTATDGGQGRIRAEGSMGLAEGLPVDLELELEKVTLVRLDELTASASGKLAVTGTLAHARISGELVTDDVEAQIVDSTAARVVELDVIEINQPGGVPRNGERTASRESALLELDLSLRMPGRVFVRGRGLDSEWAGLLKITGAPGTPIVSGELRPVRGGFSFAGKQFTLGSGSIQFDGSDEVDPMLNLPGEYSGADITATISITGRASTPEIKLTSRPPLPESEIVSRVLFGKDSKALTTGQKLGLASAVANLTGAGVSVLDKARHTLGVDVLTIDDSADRSTTKLKAGKYVTDRVYVEMEKGAEEKTGAATIEVEIAPRVKVQTGSKGQGEGKVGIGWRWDY